MSHSAERPLSGPVTVTELRARIAEMIERAESGEEVVIARGRNPVAKLVPLSRPPSRRLGTLRQLMPPADIKRLEKALSAHLRPSDQRILEGDGTDEFGIWRGLPKKRRTRR
jgi:prevent-host-death family protein